MYGVKGPAYVRGNAIGFFTSTSWSRAGIEAAPHYVRAALNTSRERAPRSKTLLGAALSWITPLDVRVQVANRAHALQQRSQV